MNATTTFRREPTVLWRRVHDGVLLLPPQLEDPILATGPSVALWALLEEPVGIDDAVDALADAYDVDAPTIREDVASLLTSLQELGAVRTDG